MTPAPPLGYPARMRFKLGGFPSSVTAQIQAQDHAGQRQDAALVDGGTVEIASAASPIRGVVESVVYVDEFAGEWEFETGEGDGWRILDIPAREET